MRLIDLARQVTGMLRIARGGTGNAFGYATATVAQATNRTGGTLQLGAVVSWGPVANSVVLAQDTDGTIAGVVVGWYTTSGAIAASDVPSTGTAAVCIKGVCRVRIQTDLLRGDYAFTGSTDGLAVGSSTRGVGAWGVFVQDGDESVRPLVLVDVWGVSDGASGGGGGSPLTTKGDLFGYSTADARIPVGTNGYRLNADSADAEGITWVPVRRAVVVELLAPSVAQQADWRWPWTGVITRWTLVADASGSAVVDVWCRAYASGIPTDAQSITASAPPTLSSGTHADSTTLTGWTTTVTRGDLARINVDSVSGITRLTLELEVTET